MPETPTQVAAAPLKLLPFKPEELAEGGGGSLDRLCSCASVSQARGVRGSHVMASWQAQRRGWRKLEMAGCTDGGGLCSYDVTLCSCHCREASTGDPSALLPGRLVLRSTCRSWPWSVAARDWVPPSSGQCEQGGVPIPDVSFPDGLYIPSSSAYCSAVQGLRRGGGRPWRRRGRRRTWPP